MSKIAICGGDQNIAILTLKTGPLTVFFTEKRYRSINIGYLSNNISNTIPLRVCSIYKTPPDWDPSESGKIWTPPDCDPSGFVKLAFLRLP